MGFAFTLRFLFPFHADAADMLVELLRYSTPYEVGVLSSGPHRATLQFHSNEPSDGGTLAAAILAVQQCVPTAQFVEAGPDWVTLTEMAGVAGISPKFWNGSMHMLTW